MPQFHLGVAKQTGESLVGFLELAIQVENRDTVLGFLEQQPAADRFIGQGRLGQLAVRDIHQEAIPYGGAVWLRQGHRVALNPTVALERVADAELQPQDGAIAAGIDKGARNILQIERLNQDAEGRRVFGENLRRDAADILKGSAGIGELQPAVGEPAKRKEGAGGGGGDLRQLLLQGHALFQRLLRQIGLGDVMAHAQGPGQAAFAVQHGGLGGFQQHPGLCHGGNAGGDRRAVFGPDHLGHLPAKEFLVVLSDQGVRGKCEEALGGGVAGHVPALGVLHPEHVRHRLENGAEDAALVLQPGRRQSHFGHVMEHNERRARAQVIDQAGGDAGPPPLAGTAFQLADLAGDAAGFDQALDQALPVLGIHPKVARRQIPLTAGRDVEIAGAAFV